MVDALEEKACTPCKGGIPPLSEEEAERFQAQVPEWDLVDHARRIEHTFQFRNWPPSSLTRRWHSISMTKVRSARGSPGPRRKHGAVASDLRSALPQERNHSRLRCRSTVLMGPSSSRIIVFRRRRGSLRSTSRARVFFTHARRRMRPALRQLRPTPRHRPRGYHSLFVTHSGACADLRLTLY